MFRGELYAELRRKGLAPSGCRGVSFALHEQPFGAAGEKPSGSTVDLPDGRVALSHVSARQAEIIGLRRSVQLVHVLSNGQRCTGSLRKNGANP